MSPSKCAWLACVVGSLFSGEVLFSADAVDVAIQQLGKPYIEGAEGPDAFDCSGLTRYVYKQVGLSIPKYSGDQASVGVGSSLPFQRGDLLFFATLTPGVVSHVGIYEDNNQMINAVWYIDQYGTEIKRVRRDDITNTYWSSKLLFGRRLSVISGPSVTFTFTGVVTSVNDSNGILGNMIGVGAPVSGTVTYELTAVDMNPANPQIGNYQYNGGPTGVTVTIGTTGGARVIATDGSTIIWVWNDTEYGNGGVADYFDVIGTGATRWELPRPVSTIRGQIFFELLDIQPPLSLLSSDSLPSVIDATTLHLWESASRGGVSWEYMTGINQYVGYGVGFKVTGVTMK